MSKATKVWLIVAVSLVVIGCVIFGGVMSVLHWDFTKLSTNRYETNTCAVSETFDSISIVTDTADVTFLPAENCSVVCYEQKNANHAVAVKDGALTVELVDARKWYEHIGIGFQAPKITVYLPETAYAALKVRESTGNVEIPNEFQFASMDISASTGKVENYASVSGSVRIRTSTGSVRVEGISAGTLDISVSTGTVTVASVMCAGDMKIRVSTGDTQITDTCCKNLISDGDTGNLSMVNVVAQERLSLERDTGSILFEKCDAGEISMETDTGHVKGTLLSEKVFFAESDTGKVDIPQTTTGGKCEISTDTGNIKIRIDGSF